MSDPRELLERVRAGDDAAWRELVERYQRLVYATVRGFRLSDADAEDVFQELFLRLHRHASHIQSAQALPAWITITTRRLCIDVLRRTRPSVPIVEDVHVAPGESDETRWSRLQSAQAVREALAELPERCQRLLTLLYFEMDEPDYQEVSRQLQMPVGSIGPTRGRCLQVLLRILQSREGGSGR